ncbi:MAG: glycosyltransferase family 2 protein [Ignavibacteriae bacterium]|nr:glycosyltransferase family 2 protein [Ignavibacteriota bacterium]
MTGAGRPSVSVVIVHYNGERLLDACLASVQAQVYRPVEVILVDNGSSDGSIAMVRVKYPEVRVLAQGTNLGFAEGNNRGVEAATGEYVVLLNNDTEVTADWLPGLLEYMMDPAVAVVTSKVVTDGVPDRFYSMNGSLNPLGYNIMRVFADLSHIFFAGGASVMFRRAEIPRPFLNEYFLYHEDVFLSWRLRLLGRDVRMAQRSLVYHRGSATTKTQASAFVTFYQERNKLLNALLLFGGWTLLRLAPLMVMEGIAKLIAGTVSGRKSPLGILRGYVWILSHAGWVLARRRELQASRVVPDRDILCWMSARLLDGDGAVARVVNGCMRTYARVTGLGLHD